MQEYEQELLPEEDCDYNSTGNDYSCEEELIATGSVVHEDPYSMYTNGNKQDQVAPSKSAENPEPIQIDAREWMRAEDMRRHVAAPQRWDQTCIARDLVGQEVPGVEGVVLVAKRPPGPPLKLKNSYGPLRWGQ